LPKQVFAGVRALLIVLAQLTIQICLQRLQRSVPFLAKGDAVKLLLDRAMKAFANAVGLRRFRARAGVVDIFHRQIQLILVGPVVYVVA